MTRTERGASLVEYSLLVSLVALIAIASVRVLGGVTTKPFCLISGSLNADGASQYKWYGPGSEFGPPPNGRYVDCRTEDGGLGGSSVWY